MSDTPELVIRDFIESDVPFILGSYLKSYRDAPLNRMLSDRSYASEHSPVANVLFNLTLSRVKVAVSPEDSNQIYGYVWYHDFAEYSCVHWVYVKQPFRRFGIAGALLKTLPNERKVYSHFNHNWVHLKKHLAEYLPWYYFLKKE